MATIVMGVVLLGEPFSGLVVAGTVLVLLGIYVCSRARRTLTQ
jgi:drug/metabolite transporter (DMT)-like permease